MVRPPQQMDLKERAEVLAAIQSNLESRIRAVLPGSGMLEHAARLDAIAAEIAAKARRIRDSIAEDTRNLASLAEQLSDCQIEIAAVDVCRRRGIKSYVVVRRLVESEKKRRKKA